MISESSGAKAEISRGSGVSRLKAGYTIKYKNGEYRKKYSLFCYPSPKWFDAYDP